MSLPFLNRDAFLVKPKEKFAEWIRSIDENAADEETDQLLKVCRTIYLIEELDTGGRLEAEEHLAATWPAIAESEFAAWWLETEDWPHLNSFDDFEEFFEWTYVDMIHDMATSFISRE